MATIKGTVRGQDRVKRNMANVIREQIPFATSLAINDAVFRGRRFSLAYWIRVFPRRKNVRFPSVVFRVRKATKRRLRGVLFDSRGLALINLQVQGGIRRPERARRLAVPTDNVTFTKAGRPRRVNFRNAFRIKNTLFRRVGGKRNPRLVPVFHLTPSARITAAYHLRPIVVRMRRWYIRRIGPSIAKAIRTAR